MKSHKYWLALVLAVTWPVSGVWAAGNPEVATVAEEVEITVNINTASAEEMATLLKGIGIKKAQAIVDYREQNGVFQSKDDLLHVKGIGPAIVAQNDKRILL